jgi:hypothetical protein
MKTIRHKDLLAEWKTSRFIIADKVARAYLNNYSPGHLIVLTDIKFWADNIDGLLDWCEQYEIVGEGMILTIPDDHRLSLFVLRWS